MIKLNLFTKVNNLIAILSIIKNQMKIFSEMPYMFSVWCNLCTDWEVIFQSE